MQKPGRFSDDVRHGAKVEVAAAERRRTPFIAPCIPVNLHCLSLGRLKAPFQVVARYVSKIQQQSCQKFMNKINIAA